MVARPDLATVGIERVWSRAKRLYRAEVERLQAHNRPYDHFGVVQHILEGIPEDFAQHQASLSLKIMDTAQPIFPLNNEDKPQMDMPLFIAFSPNQQPLDYIGYHSPDHNPDP